MSFTNETTHYGLPQWIGSDKPTYLVDQNNAYQKIDAEIYNANTTAGAAQTAAEGAVATAGAASSTAADALTAAQTASSTADHALTEAQTANTNAQAAQTAAGAAQTAAQAAQEAAAGNSITNLAPAYDPTITYAVDDLVTAEGKLYKCIVAVTTPEQFDINKWDDVTTSEVYSRQADFLKRVNCDASSCLIMSTDPSDTYESVLARDGNTSLSITYVKTRNVLLLQYSGDGDITSSAQELYPTIAVGQTLNIKIDTFATVTASDTVQIPIQSPRFFDANANNYSVSINYCLLSHKEGTAGTYQLTAPTIGLIAMRKDCALVNVKSADITSESYPVNSIAQAYIDITITRNS